MRQYGESLPEFAGRFGVAYKAEVAAFIACCQANKPFPVTHTDGLQAQQVIEAAMRSAVRPEPITSA
jgi:predicted dehydrogenase